MTYRYTFPYVLALLTIVVVLFPSVNFVLAADNTPGSDDRSGQILPPVYDFSTIDSELSVPRRDDPGDQWIVYDDSLPAQFWHTRNCWNRVIFTTPADFELWGVNIMLFNVNNHDDPMTVRVYRQNQQSNDLTDLLWEDETDDLPSEQWIWMELDQDDRPTFNEGEEFSVVYGPAPGGDEWQGGGWSALGDRPPYTERSLFMAGDEPAENFDEWEVLRSDLMVRANGEFTGQFVDLRIGSVYNHEKLENRRWTIWQGDRIDFYTVIHNDGTDVGAFDVTCRLFNPQRQRVFENTVEVDGLEQGDSLVIQCPEDWEVDGGSGLYEFKVSVMVDDDIDEDNNALGLDQIVINPNDAPDTWLGYTGGDNGGMWAFDNNADGGWGAIYTHPGGENPLWLTDFRVMTFNGFNNNIELECRVYTFDQENNEVEQVWSGTGVPTDRLEWMEFNLDPDEYILLLEGQSVLVSWMQAENVRLRRALNPPQAAANRAMPDAMWQTVNNGQDWELSGDLDCAIQVKLSGMNNEWSGVIEGTVRDFGTNQPVEGAIVSTSDGSQTLTNENGWYSIRNFQPDPFDLSVSKFGYNDSTITDIDLDVTDTLIANIALKAPLFELSEENIRIEADLDSMIHRVVTIRNPGNGFLDWFIKKEAVGEFEYEPWEYRVGINAAEAVHDYQLAGIAFIDNHYYVSGSQQDTNRIYVLDRDGNLERSFPQVGMAADGMQDLAFDGQLLWGSGERNIYGFSLDGELVETIRGPFNTITGIAWDNIDSRLWVCGPVSNICGIDMNGEITVSIENPGLTIASLFFYPDDPDGSPLYALCVDENNVNRVTRFNPATGDFTHTARFNLSGLPKGAFATNEVDPYSWTLLSIYDISQINGGDRINIHEIYPNASWVMPELTNGLVQADSEQEVVLTFATTGLPQDRFMANLKFNHNAVDTHFILPVELNVEISPRPPSAFNLLSPMDDGNITEDNVGFVWSRSFDPNPQDELSYVLWLQADDDSVMFESETNRFFVNLAESGLEPSPNTRFRWWVQAVSGEDLVESDNRFGFTFRSETVSGGGLSNPTDYVITDVHPNPFNSTTTITYGLPSSGNVSLIVYNINGQEVQSLFHGNRLAGYYSLQFNAIDIPSGLYFIKLQSGTAAAVKKVMLVR